MKNKYAEIQNTKANIDSSPISWQNRQFSYPTRTIRLATSFSGIGAIEHAFHRLGLNCEIQFAGDIDENCKKAYFANYSIREEQWHTDVHNFDARPFKGKVDLFVGGAPCQAFSLRGKHGGFSDTRGTLFREFARIVIECQPKVFIFENVQGLFKHDNGRTWQVIYNTFCDYCGYDVHYQLLNARDYGIPQTRERLYCVGFKKETKFKYPAPIPLPYRMYDFLEDYSECDFFNKDKNVKFLAGNKERSKLLSEGKVKEEFNDFIFKDTSLCLFYCHFSKRDTHLVSCHCCFIENLINLLLREFCKFFLSFAHCFHLRFQCFYAVYDCRYSHLFFFLRHFNNPPVIDLVS